MWSHSPLSWNKLSRISHPSIRLIFLRLLKFFFEIKFFLKGVKEELTSKRLKKKKNKKDGMIILDYIVLHIQMKEMQHERNKIFVFI